MYKETDYVFQNAYLRAQGNEKSADEAFGELAAIGAGEVLAVQRLAYDYHNLKVLIRAEVGDLKDYEDILEANGTRSLEQLREMDIAKEAREAYAKTRNSRDIDEVLDADFFREREKLVRNAPDPLLREIFEAEREEFEAQRARRRGEEVSKSGRLDELMEQADKQIFGLAPIYRWWIECLKRR